MKLFEVDDETIGDAIVDRSPDIEVELIRRQMDRWKRREIW